MIIVIPYRNREEHLNLFLEKTYPLLLQYIDFKLVVIEQVGGKKFNRGKLINIGYDLNPDCSWIMTHDVDINPKEHIIKDLYSLEKSILGIYTSGFGTIGGIVKMSGEHYKQMNGFTNDYWGWGCEDKNLQNRAEFFKLPIYKNYLNNDPNRFLHFEIFNDIDDRERDYSFSQRTNFEYGEFKKLSDVLKMKNIMASGLNTLVYDIIRQDKIDNIEKITVSI